ncbi:MAG: alpha-mannosidase [Eubacteriales bacterium]|nr:alpha-mannosidase [Eubacteriales bacterium]
MKKKTVHIISHSHWDREWYLPLERHKMKLLDLIDTNMKLFAEDPGFRSFHLDGQTIVLDDYLEIRPEKRKELEKYVREGRFRVGPFYILQDEFLTSGEANVRNIQTGIREAKAYGNLTKVGYFPDAFGNAGQMPQLLKQAGMEAVAFGRGVKPVGFNNELKKGGEYESAYSEMEWESPDGTKLLGILFANWYNNGMEIPVDEKEAKAYWDERLAKAEMFASTDELLFMNGCDHQPVQQDLSAAIETARRLYPDIEFVHSNFEDYVKKVSAEAGNRLSTVKGELTSQETNGWYTLVNTCSSHVVLKRMNRMNEVALERVAEPLAAFAAESGREYPHDRLNYAWKILMQNHPHDSICGCSVDQVNKEIEVRFDRSTEVAHTISEDASSYLAEKIDTSAFSAYGKDAVPFVLFNTDGSARSGAVKLILDARRDYNKWIWDGRSDMLAWKLPEYRVVDDRGHVLDAVVKDAGVKFGYDLPDDKFRQPYMARQVEVTVFVENMPALGYVTCALVPADCLEAQGQTAANAGGNLLAKDARHLENESLAVTVNEDGTLDVLDKQTGRSYTGLGYFEDTLDAGNEYIYFCPEGNPAIVTKGTKAQVVLEENTDFAASVRITHVMRVPVSADGTLKEEQEGVVEFMKRTCRRSADTTELCLNTTVTLEKGSRTLKFKTELDNTARDHRLRVVMPTHISCTHHYADTVFEVVKRPNEHSRLWENPCKCEHQQCFVGLNDEKGGLLASNIGLYEYEILPEQDNALAITILRSVGEMGDWGVFPTELSQQLRHITAEYALTFFSGDLVETDSFREAYQFQVPVTAVQTKVHGGELPAAKSWLTWEGRRMMFSNFKDKSNGTDRMARFVNCSGQPTVLRIQKDASFEKMYFSNVLEEEVRPLEANADGWYEIPVRGFEIVTVGMK